MKRTTIIISFLFATSALFAQSINANFQTDAQGWRSHQESVRWSNLFPPMEDRGGISFSGENMDGNLFLFIQKEITDLLPNRNYRVMFNMNWLAWMDISASSIIVKVGAVNYYPTLDVSANPNFYSPIVTTFDKGKIGQNGRDFIVAGRLTPNQNGHPFLQNVHNFDNTFFVNTDDEGRLFLMIGVESENEKIENVYLSTLRVLLHENGEAREIQTTTPSLDVAQLSTENTISEEEEEDPAVLYYEEGSAFSPVIPDMVEEISSGIEFISKTENDFVFFKSNFNDEIEMLGIYTEDNHLMKIFSFRNPSVERAFQTTGLPPGTYRIEFILVDGRIINQMYTIK